MKITKYFPQFGALLMLAGLTVPLFSLSAGYFAKDAETEDSAADRPNPDVTLSAPSGQNTDRPAIPFNPNTQPSDDPEFPQYADNLSKVMSIDAVDGLYADRTAVSLSTRVENYRRLLASIAVYSGDGTLLLTDGYDSESVTVAAGSIYDLPYSSGSEVITRYSKLESNSDASYVTVATPVSVERQSVKPYMGYLLIASDEGRKIALYDTFGNLLSGNVAGFEPYYARDFENRPVFVRGGDYFVFDTESAGMIPIGEHDIRAGLFYDYPAYEVSANGYEVKFDPESGYMKFFYEKTNRFRLSGFFRAFNFSENLAVIMRRTENFVRVINPSGSVQFEPDTWYDYHTGVVGQVMSVGDIYTLPDTFGIESMGVQGYDHGWLRLRVKTYSQNYQTRGKIVRDSYRLVDTKGRPFEIPEGYTLEGYSDGVLLLKKNGLYGYYTVDHKWIAQPIYSHATPFIQGLAVVGFADGTVGMIDTKGNIVLPFVFTTLSTPSSGIVVGYCEGVGYQVFYLTRNAALTDSANADE